MQHVFFPFGSCHLAVIPLAGCSTSTQTATIEDLSLAADVQPLEQALLIAGCFGWWFKTLVVWRRDDNQELRSELPPPGFDKALKAQRFQGCVVCLAPFVEEEIIFDYL